MSKITLEKIAILGEIDITADPSSEAPGHGYTIQVYAIPTKTSLGHEVRPKPDKLIGVTCDDPGLDTQIGPVLAAVVRERVQAGISSITLKPVEIAGLQGQIAERIRCNAWSLFHEPFGEHESPNGAGTDEKYVAIAHTVTMPEMIGMLRQRDQLVDLVAEAARPGGIGPDEFACPGGWLERACGLVGLKWPPEPIQSDNDHAFDAP
jgi:hypothetical protein